MQIISPNKETIYDWYPVKNVSGDTSERWFLKIQTILDSEGYYTTKKKQFVTKRNMIAQINECIFDKLFNVVDFHVIPQLGNPNRPVD